MRRPDSPEVLRIGDMLPSSVESCFRELDDVFLQTQARIWLGEVLHARFDEEMAISDLLADGELLFQVSKAIWKKLLTEYGDIKYSKSYIYERNASGKCGGRYMPYSNVDAFLKICQILGLTGIDLFSPSDVVEKRDIRRVCMCIRSLSKKARLKHLNVPDFDVVTYTIAMPTDVVGGLRRSLERAQYSFSSPMSSKEVRRSIHGADHIRHCDFSSEESEEAESSFGLIEYQSPISVTSFDSATLSYGNSEDLPEQNPVEGTLGMGENLFLLDHSKEEKKDYILSCTYSPQSSPQCRINTNGSSYCMLRGSVDSTCSPDNPAEVCDHDYDYWETSVSSIGDSSMETEKKFLAGRKKNYGDQIYNSPVPWDESATSPTVRFDYLQEEYSRLSVDADSVDETGLSGFFEGSWNHTSNKTLLNGNDQLNTNEDCIRSDFSLSKLHKKEKIHLNLGVSGIKDFEDTAKENTHMEHELPHANSREIPQNKEQIKGYSMAGGTDVGDIRCNACKREPLPLVDDRCMEYDNVYHDGYSDQCGGVLDRLVGSFDFATDCNGEKSSMILKGNNIPGISTVSEPLQAVYPIQLHENFVSSKSNSLSVMNFDVSTAAEESNIKLNMTTKFSSRDCFCSSQIDSLPDDCQFFAHPSVLCSGEERMQEVCSVGCSHQDKVQVDFFMEYSGKHLVHTECNSHCSCQYNVKKDCSIHYSRQTEIEEVCHVDSLGENKMQEVSSLVNPSQNKTPEVRTVDCCDQGKINENCSVDCSVQDDLGDDCNAVPVVEDSKGLSKAKVEVPVYSKEDCLDVRGENYKDPGTPKEEGTESCCTPELVPFSLESDQPFLTSLMENVNDANDTTGEFKDCGQTFADDKHLVEHGAKRHENVQSTTGNMDEGKPGMHVIGKGRKNKESRKQFLKSFAGGLTLFGAAFFIFHISRRGGKVQMDRSVIPSCQKRQTREGLQKGKAAAVYPGEKLNFQD
ncbi:hypothetical protein H6P81_011094 [Aristolochia fimbriata]|uniref:Calponin-homology (CH) domain-containing protein n=1 Tax=Aristolochia fimbriata TaxID=158543 RepID=A0AAV7ERA9_ARIFI|nr:hypothetical protein H6P81_011094 [Aristolochia fimbriata]